MPDFDVTAPDGKVYTVTAPEGASEQDIIDYAREQIGGASKAPPVKFPNPNRRQTIGVADRGNFLENARDIAHNIATGAVKGVTSLTGMIPDMLNLPATIGEGIGNLTGIGGTEARRRAAARAEAEGRPAPVTHIPGGSSDQQDVFFNNVMPEYVPATLGGRLGQGVVGGATGAAIPSPAMVGTATRLGAAALGGLSGGTGEAAGILTDDNPVAMALGSLLPYGAKIGSDVMRGRAAINAARDALPTDPVALQAARDREAVAAAHGFRLTPGQALGDTGAGVRGLESATAASSVGAGPAGSFIRAQREGADRAIENAVGALGPRNSNLVNLTSDVAEGAANRQQQFRDWRTADMPPSSSMHPPVAGGGAPGARTLYQLAETQTIPATELRPIITDIQDQIARKGERSDVGRILLGYLDDLRAAAPMDAPGARLGPLNEMRKTYRDGIRSTVPAQDISAADRAAAAIIGPINEQLGTILERNNPAFAEAQRLFRARSGPVEYAERPDVLGRLVSDAEKDPLARFTQQVSVIADPKRTSPQIIDNVFSEMDASSRPRAMAQLGAKYFDIATENAKGSATKFHDQIYGSPKRREITESILGNIARANNQNPAEVQRGWRRLLDVVDQTRRYPQVGSPTATRNELNKAFSEAGIFDVISEGVPVVSHANKKMSAAGLRTNYRLLADAFFGDRAGIDALVALSQRSATSEAARSLVAGYLAGQRGATASQEPTE